MSTHFFILRKNLKKKIKLVFYNQLTFSCQKDLYTMKLLQNKRRKLINRYSGMLQRASHRISSWSHWLLRISQIPNLIVISLFIFTFLKEIIAHRRTKHRLLFYKMNTGCSWKSWFACANYWFDWFVSYLLQIIWRLRWYPKLAVGFQSMRRQIVSECNVW